MQLYGQMNPGKPVPSFVEIISSSIKNDGITAVYKGVDAASKLCCRSIKRSGFATFEVSINNSQPTKHLKSVGKVRIIELVIRNFQ